MPIHAHAGEGGAGDRDPASDPLRSGLSRRVSAPSFWKAAAMAARAAGPSHGAAPARLRARETGAHARESNALPPGPFPTPDGLSLTALMEPPMSGLMEPLTGADPG